MTPEKLSPYQVQAASELLALAKSLPLTHRLTFECRGIVGGDFDVIVTRQNGKPLGDHFDTEIRSR